MPVTSRTIRLARGGRINIGNQVDDVTRELVKAWARAWDQLVAEVEAAALDMASGTLTDAGVVARLRLTSRAKQALDRVRNQLERLSAAVDIRVSNLATDAIEFGGILESDVLRSQLPRGSSSLIVSFDTVPKAVVDEIVTRTTEQITSTTIPLGRSATEAMKRALVSGVPLGRGPRETARLMVRGAEKGFNGGLARAVAIARTETLDAFRAGASVVRERNSDVVNAVEWFTTFDDRVCPACLGMAGQRFPADTRGPDGHVQCRCIFIPVTASWKELGIPIDEVEEFKRETGPEWFDKLPREKQLAIMGPGRLSALESGQIGWEDMGRFKSNDGWRDSLQTVPLKELGVKTAAGVA